MRIYEVEMVVRFIHMKGDKACRTSETTLTEIIDAEDIADAYSKAVKMQHGVVVDIASGEKKLHENMGFGSISGDIAIRVTSVKRKLD